MTTALRNTGGELGNGLPSSYSKYGAIRREIVQAILENSDDALALVNGRFEFVAVNQAYARSYGYDPGELIGENRFDLFPDPTTQTRFMRAKDSGVATSFTDKLWSANGQVSWKVIPVKDFDGTVEGLVLKSTRPDGTQDQWKNEVLGLLSHELRSPLTVLSGAIKTILSEGDHLAPEEVRQLLQDADAEAESLSQLLWNLLEASRSQAHKLVLSVNPCSIASVVRSAIGKAARQSPTHRFKLEIPSRLPKIEADELRVERVLFNLLENAIKYSPKGSEVRVFAREEPSQMLIGVADEGIGIPSEDQARIFEPFQRLDRAGNGSVKGTGLGLLVCHKLVEAHGGQIWVESEPGKGSTFFFTLPLHQTRV